MSTSSLLHFPMSPRVPVPLPRGKYEVNPEAKPMRVVDGLPRRPSPKSPGGGGSASDAKVKSPPRGGSASDAKVKSPPLSSSSKRRPSRPSPTVDGGRRIGLSSPDLLRPSPREKLRGFRAATAESPPHDPRRRSPLCCNKVKLSW